MPEEMPSIKREIAKLDVAELNARLGTAREKERLRDTENRRKHAEHEKRAREADDFKSKLMENLSPASVEDYKRWLRGYLEGGGKVTHVYDYPMSQQDFYVAHKDFKFEKPLYGAQSIKIIVPRGVRFLGGDLGHANLYFEDDYRASSGFVPIFEDIKF
ncbi:MAG: hypothetical protein Q7R94_03275 [bacterium]|nr:hypothetical protein [bacterium]